MAELVVKVESCWGQRSKNFWIFLCTAIIVCAILVAVLTWLVLVSGNEESLKVLSKMNLKADPCDDFYEFACGKFVKEAVIPKDRLSITTYSSVIKKVESQLRDILIEPIRRDEIEPFQNVKRIYRSCMKTEITNLTSRDFFKVERAPSNHTRKSWPFQKASKNTTEGGLKVDSFFSTGVTINSKNPSRRIIFIKQPGTLKNFKTFGHALRQRHSIEDVLHLIDASQQAKIDLLNFNAQHENIFATETGESFYVQQSVAELQRNYPYNDWLSYFNKFLPPASQIESDYVVQVFGVSYFTKLRDLLKETPRETLENFIAAMQLIESLKFAPKSAVHAFSSMRNALAETTESQSQDCVESSLFLLPFALSGLYVRKHFPGDVKLNVEEMVKNIKNEFKIMLKKNFWLDEITRNEAIKKIEAMKDVIGYPKGFTDDAIIVTYHNRLKVKIDDDDFLGTAEAIEKEKEKEKFAALFLSVDDDLWIEEMNPAVINAAYVPVLNAMYFPAAILQDVFFDADRPEYMNYGSIGHVIGHEITHGFDEEGSKYDAHGNLKDWWTPDTKIVFDAKCQCLVDQYGNFTEPLTNTQVNGTQTLGENIADIGGIKAAYRAYNRWAEGKSVKALPGLDFTPRQMIWISTSQLWCGKFSNEAIKFYLENDTHSHQPIRVLGTLQNSEDFAADFQCSSTSRMNPRKKCEVW